MAGDWIKMRKGLGREIEVLRLCELLDIAPRVAIGLIYDFWSWADDVSANGPLPNVTLVQIDSVMNVDGFGTAMVTIGWLDEVDDGLLIPNFERHMGKSAKRRAMDTVRKQETRTKKGQVSASQADKVRTREEKRREEKRRDEGITCHASGDADDPSAPKATVESMFMPDARRLAQELYEAILAHTPGFKIGARPSQRLEGWSRDIEKALRIDGHSADDVRNAISFAHSSPEGAFWRPNVLSGAKLRERLQRLLMESRGKSANGRAKGISTEDIIAGNF